MHDVFSKSFRSAPLVVGVAGYLLVAAGQFLQAQDAVQQPLSSAELVEIVASSIEANYAQLRTIEATVSRTEQNSFVKESLVHTGALPDGMKFRVRMAPERHSQRDYFYEEDNFLCEDADLTQYPGKSQPLQRSLLWKNEIETEYTPGSRLAVIRSMSDLGVRGPIDIRHMAASQIGHSLIDELRDGHFTAHAQEPYPSFMIVEATRALPGECRATITFASEFAFLPSSTIIRRADASVLSAMHIEYQSPMPGVSFPSRIEKRFYAPGVSVAPDAQGWTQRVEYRVLRSAFNEPLSRPLAVRFAEGTIVNDRAHGKRYRVGE